MDEVRQDVGWQPIETAPRDGMNLLLWADSLSGEGVCVGYWGRDFWGEMNWCMEAGDYWPGATHWMPLPPPPVAHPTLPEQLPEAGITIGEEG